MPFNNEKTKSITAWLQPAIRDWHKKQSANLRQDFFLYYRLSEQGGLASLSISSSSLSNDWKQVSPQKISPRMSGRQVFDWALSESLSIPLTETHQAVNTLNLIELKGFVDVEKAIFSTIDKEVKGGHELIESGVKRELVADHVRQRINESINTFQAFGVQKEEAKKAIDDAIIDAMNGYSSQPNIDNWHLSQNQHSSFGGLR